MELVDNSQVIVWVVWDEAFKGGRGLLNIAFTWLPLRWIMIFGVIMGFASSVSWLSLGVLGDILAIWSSVMLVEPSDFGWELVPERYLGCPPLALMVVFFKY